MDRLRTYSELITIPTFEERFEYLKLNGVIGENTFGYDRYLNQMFYKTKEWERIRDKIITRDFGCDLGVEGLEISGSIYVHHMNPITKQDILDRTDYLLNPDYLICCSFRTHQAITYGDEKILSKPYVERTLNDTCPWKH